MNARKYSGGSRGPRRPGSRKVKVRRRSGKAKGGICDMVVLAPASVVLVMPLAIALVVTR